MARLEDLIAKVQGSPEFEFAQLAIEIGEEIVQRMDELGINQTELARRMGVSRARVSQVLSGSDNLTLRTLVGVANALDARLSVRVERRSGAKKERMIWRDVSDSPTAGNKGHDPRALAQAS